MKYIIGVEIETDEPLSIQSAQRIMKEQINNGTAKVISAEIPDDEDEETFNVSNEDER